VCGKPTLSQQNSHIFFADRHLYPEPPSPLPQSSPTALTLVVGLPYLFRAYSSPLGLSAINRLRLKGVWAADLQQVPCPFA
jgi:hypothetical protein